MVFVSLSRLRSSVHVTPTVSLVWDPLGVFRPPAGRLGSDLQTDRCRRSRRASRHSPSLAGPGSPSTPPAPPRPRTRARPLMRGHNRQNERTWQNVERAHAKFHTQHDSRHKFACSAPLSQRSEFAARCLLKCGRSYHLCLCMSHSE